MFPGLGGSGRTARSLRLTLIGGLLVVGLMLHNIGGDNSYARFVRIGLFGAAVMGIALAGTRRGAPMRSNPQGGTSSIPGGSGAPAEPGWYPLPGQAAIQQYWDGSAWGQRRRWDGKTWVLD